MSQNVTTYDSDSDAERACEMSSDGTIHTNSLSASTQASHRGRQRISNPLATLHRNCKLLSVPEHGESRRLAATLIKEFDVQSLN